MHVFVQMGGWLGCGVALLGMEGNYPNGFVVVLSRPPLLALFHGHVHGQTVSN